MNTIKAPFKHSLFIKISSIGVIIMLLMIPNKLIKDLISERNFNQKSVINEVSDKWGKEQQIIGPVLTIPYKSYFQDKSGKALEHIKFSNFLPEHLNINGEIHPENRKRGLYNVILYQSIINCSGWFKTPSFEKLGVDKSHLLLEKAFLQVSIPDMAGINENITLKYDDKSYRMEPGIEQINGFISGVKIPVEIDMTEKELKFDFDLNLNGSNSLTFGPIGKETNVNLHSNWNSPSFMGSFLPDEHSISDAGFSASWKILDLNRNYPQAWLGEQINLLQSSFGVKLMQPIDEYAKNFRSAKYALLVISLTFLVFFFFEVINKQQVHSMHYIFVGLSISIFYILLLSLSEHLGFNLAYLLSSLSIVGLVGSYSTTILETKTLALILAGIMSAIIGFIFILLQLEDYALLTGSIGLLIVLASAMYCSRNIDWNTLSKIHIKEPIKAQDFV